MADPIQETISPRQERAVLALLREASVQKVAESIGVHEKTIYRWLRDPAFAAVYQRTRQEAFSQAIALTQKYSAMAVQALAKIMLDPTLPAGSRVAAASHLLRFGREGAVVEQALVNQKEAA